MCRLFIVEDEEIIREGIQKNIDWELNDVKIVGTAANGKECLEKIETCMPEVILSDIKMPFMDGMELIQHIYELYPKIKVVLLTAFDEFEYAKKALNYKVSQYVMKYEENEKILEAVLRAGNEYTASLNQAERVKQSEILLENKILRDLLFYDEKSEEIYQNLLNSNIKFLYDNFFVTCISNRNLTQSKHIRSIAEGYNFFEREIRILGLEIDFYFCKTEQKLFIISNLPKEADDSFDKFIKILENLLKHKEKEWQCNLKASVGSIYNGLEGISKSYDEANYIMSLYQMNQYFDRDKRTVIVSSNDSVSGSANKKTVEQIVEYIKKHYWEKDISLDSISKDVHLTPAYISAMFKKEKGINISDYIIKIRIERAKYLLMTTDMKTYEISEEIGYVNSQYFSVLFKRNAGVSPTEYRQRVSGK
ncbi:MULTISPECIES: response regulator [unclassified Clostridium]|uniref:response regulator n=1 Tax=unclassified Clostridium TaxID=2614128 RepID=UPI001EEB82B8|nr:MULTISPECIES: response regulator [unclassified Clostridium]